MRTPAKQTFRWPTSPGEAHAMRTEIAATLREWAADLEAGEIDFERGDVITVQYEQGPARGGWPGHPETGGGAGA